MPHLVKWHNELSPFGLTILAPHVQNAKADEIKAKADKLGIRFTISNRGSVAGSEAKGIPACHLFDHDGKQIFEGHPSRVENVLREAVGSAIVGAAGADRPSRSLAPIVDALRKGQPPLQSVQKLLTLQRSTDGTTARQAKALVARILAGGQQRLDGAVEMVKRDPVTAFETAQELLVSFKGTPIAPKANELARKLRGDRIVQAELKARPSLARIRAIDFALSERPTDEDTKSPEFQKRYAGVLKQMSGILATMKRNWPDTKATNEAIEICDEYGIGK